MKNTELELVYADSYNNKVATTVVLEGAITQEGIDILDMLLVDGGYLIAHEVGLPTPSEQITANGNLFPTEADHIFTRIEDIYEGTAIAEQLHTDRPATVNMDIAGLIKAIQNAPRDEAAEMERQGFTIGKIPRLQAHANEIASLGLTTRTELGSGVHHNIITAIEFTKSETHREDLVAYHASKGLRAPQVETTPWNRAWRGKSPNVLIECVSALTEILPRAEAARQAHDLWFGGGVIPLANLNTERHRLLRQHYHSSPLPAERIALSGDIQFVGVEGQQNRGLSAVTVYVLTTDKASGRSALIPCRIATPPSHEEGDSIDYSILIHGFARDLFGDEKVAHQQTESLFLADQCMILPKELRGTLKSPTIKVIPAQNAFL